VEPSGTVGIPSVPLAPVDVLEAAAALVLDVWLQPLLGAELRPAVPVCAASVPTPPALKRPPEPIAVVPLPVPEPATPGTPALKQAVAVSTPIPVVALTGAGLMPGVASSVVPRGIPVGPTEEPPEGIPSGEVVPIPGLIPVTCACAQVQLTRSAVKVAIGMRVIGRFILNKLRVLTRRRRTNLTIGRRGRTPASYRC
jgi:hypothetical protein